MRHGVSIALGAMLVVLLIAFLIVQAWVLPAEVATVVAVFPETAPISVPSIIWGVIAIACWQAVAAICLRLLVLARRPASTPFARRWLRAMVGCLLTFIVLDVSAFVALVAMGFTTPGVMLGLIFGGLLALICVLASGGFLLSRRPTPHPSHV